MDVAVADNKHLPDVLGHANRDATHSRLNAASPSASTGSPPPPREVLLDSEPAASPQNRSATTSLRRCRCNPMKPSHELAELLEVDRATLIRLDVLPQAQLRAVDDVRVRERRCHREALRRQPAAKATWLDTSADRGATRTTTSPARKT